MPIIGELNYIAGLLDGEGSIFIHKDTPRNGRHAPSYSACVQVKMTDPEPVMLCFKLFGGHSGSKRKTPAGKRIYEWRVSGRKAETCLKRMLPLLRIKRRIRNAKRCLLLMQRKKSGLGPKRLSSVEIRIRERLYRECKRV